MNEDHDIVYDQNQQRLSNLSTHRVMQNDSENKFRISLSLLPEITNDFGCGTSQRWKYFDEFFIFGQENEQHDMLWTRV